MRRRRLVAIAGATSLAWPLRVTAQQRSPMPMIGFLGITSAEASHATLAAFLGSLKEAGYVLGRNVAIEFRWAQGQLDLLPVFASDLVAHKVAVIVAPSIPAALAARNATQLVPIIFAAGSSVEVGLAASINRPGGNATGVDIFVPDLIPKRLELLRDLQPAARSVAFFTNPDGTSRIEHEKVAAAAHALGFDLQLVRARTGTEIDLAFAQFAGEPPDAILAGIDPLFYIERHRVIALAAQHRIPAIYEWPESSAAGGLISLGPSLIEVNRMIGIYTAKILAGSKPADLPVQHPTHFELVINLRTAKSLGLTMPTALLLRADKVIE